MRRAALIALGVLLAAGCRGGCDEHSARGEEEQRARLPAVERLPEVAELPDPFALEGGGRVRTRADWSRRRRQLRELLLTNQYGHAPPPPGRIAARTASSERLAGGARKRVVALSTGPAGRVKLYLGLIEPPAPGPHPAIVHIDHRGPFELPTSTVEQITRRGYVLVGLDPGHLDPDQPGIVGPAQAAYPEGKHDWATLAVWAWGASRALDHLLTLKSVDGRRVVVTGHSRSGKAALLAGALDERFALVAPAGSGCAGAAVYRHKGGGTETLDAITRSFPHWFVPRLRAFAGKERRLPFDQHFLYALVAPRPLLTLDARGDRWADPPGTQQAHLAAREVYAFLGATARLGINLRPGQHELAHEDWLALLDFADQVLPGDRGGSGRRFDRLPFPEQGPRFSWRAPR